MWYFIRLTCVLPTIAYTTRGHLQAVVHLHPLPPELQGKDLDFLGPKIDPATATGIALGEVDPISKQPFKDSAGDAATSSTTAPSSTRTFLSSARTKRKRPAAAVPDHGQKSMLSFLHKPSASTQRAFKRPRKRGDARSSTVDKGNHASLPPSPVPMPAPPSPDPTPPPQQQTARRRRKGGRNKATAVRRSKFFGTVSAENKRTSPTKRRKKCAARIDGPSPSVTAAKFGGTKLRNFISPCVNSKFKIFTDNTTPDTALVRKSTRSDSPPEVESPPTDMPSQSLSNEEDVLSSDELNVT